MNVPDLFVRMTDSIHSVLKVIDRSSPVSIALVVDGERRLLATVTDGDVRRAILRGVALDAPVRDLFPPESPVGSRKPVTAPAGTAPDRLLRRMRQTGVRQVPLLDAAGRVTDIVTLSDLLPEQDAQDPPLRAVIMAGGFGTRLRPVTLELQVPKPMVPVGDRPLMEHNVGRLRDAGVRRIHVATHFLPEKIVEHFGDGEAFGVRIDYLHEDSPLGTAGALGLMPAPEEPVLVINGDVLTQVNVRALFDFHQEQQAELTVATRRYHARVPYGVVECDGPAIRKLTEKPSLSFFVNAGIYLLSPAAFRYIEPGKRLDMTDLIQRLLDDSRPVASFPLVEYWLDVGRPADYQQAQKDVEDGKLEAWQAA